MIPTRDAFTTALDAALDARARLAQLVADDSTGRVLLGAADRGIAGLRFTRDALDAAIRAGAKQPMLT